ncbi:hypothetical protein NL108_007859 [Boleophthalmus pectinirostris]|nr:hypothetical protein NL108_007859 [Boleophthalmus pectinirostris]
MVFFGVFLGVNLRLVHAPLLCCLHGNQPSLFFFLRLLATARSLCSAQKNTAPGQQNSPQDTKKQPQTTAPGAEQGERRCGAGRRSRRRPGRAAASSRRRRRRELDGDSGVTSDDPVCEACGGGRRQTHGTGTERHTHTKIKTKTRLNQV